MVRLLSQLAAIALGALLFAPLASCQDVPFEPTPSPGHRGPSQPDHAGELAPQASKVDLLLMVDSSPSMAEKQTVLAEAIPDLLERLEHPRCIRLDGSLTGAIFDPTSGCPVKSEREFEPVDEHPRRRDVLVSRGARSDRGL